MSCSLTGRALIRAAITLAATVTSAATVAACSPATFHATSTRDSSNGTSVVTTTVTVPSSNAAGLRPLGDANKTQKTLRPEAPGSLMVTDVRIGTHQGFDRIVFDFTGEGTPGWFIDYDDKPTAQGSGKPVGTQGDTFLNINIDGVAYPFELGQKPSPIGTVTGPGPIVQEVTEVGTFEGRSQFIAGLKGGKHPYSAQVLHNPTRLVIDILQS